MLYVCVRRFDVIDTVGKFLRIKQGHNNGSSLVDSTQNPSICTGSQWYDVSSATTRPVSPMRQWLITNNISHHRSTVRDGVRLNDDGLVVQGKATQILTNLYILYRCNPLSVIIIFLSILVLPHHQSTKCHVAMSSTH